MSRRRQVLLVSGVAVALGVFLVTVPTFRHFFDLGVYRGAVRAWLIDGADLYAYLYPGSEYGFTYPPFAAVLLSPLALTSWPVAVAASLLVNAAMVALLLRWHLVPVLDRHGWPRGTPVALTFLAIVLFEPGRDTFSFGQVNLILLVLVCADVRALPHGRFAGVGIGLAAAIKLTPAVFIGYLLVTRQYRAAATATGTAAVATLLTVVIAPAESRAFWTGALWDTGRVGHAEYVSNQSLHGVLARLDAPSVLWPAAVLVTLVLWFLVVRRSDLRTGFALTGLLACLISPITWVHHLVWLLPALFLLADRALRDRDRRALGGLGVAYVLLCSSLVWVWWSGTGGWLAFLGSNAYVWVTLALAVALVRPGQRWGGIRRKLRTFVSPGSAPAAVRMPRR